MANLMSSRACHDLHRYFRLEHCEKLLPALVPFTVVKLD